MKKTIELTVTLSVEPWMTKAQARREVRSLINDQSFTGQRMTENWDEAVEDNFRCRKVV